MDFGSALLSFLAGATVRSLVLALLALALLAALRVKSASARHAVLFLATAGMLAMAALHPLLPALPLRVLRVAPAAAPLPELPVPAAALENAAAPAVAPPPAPASWMPQLLAAAYFAGLLLCLMRLLFGALFTHRLLRGAIRIESDLGSEVYESSWISVPLTVGWRHPRILLPAGWRGWERIKLDAVLVHERNHIRRGDWAIALAAAVNRSLYWFNPLAWWLERRLAALAEQSCDDAALLALGERESYAQALLDMAGAVKTGQGRLVWDAMAMAKGAEVRMRIERILDDSRQIPRGLTRSRWMVLLACSLPLIYFTAALRPEPAAAQDQTPAAIADLLKARPNLTAADAAQIEQYLTTNPVDLQARERLVLYYFSAGVRDPRLTHIYWLIANHPESNEAALTSQGITPRATSFNTTADYEHAAALWRQQAVAHPSDPAVLLNAGMYFAQPGGDPNEAERLFLEVQVPPLGGTGALAKLYATAILGTFGDPKYPNDNPDFGNRVRSQIESSTNGMLLQLVGAQLGGGGASFHFRDGISVTTIQTGAIDFNQHPLLPPARELGNRLMALAAKFTSTQRPAAGNFIDAARELALARQKPVSTTSEGDPGQSSQAGGAIANRPPASVQDTYPQLAALPQAPTPVSRQSPAYPPLARMARIQGTVILAVTIGTDGHVTSVSVLRGHPLLVQAALDAVRQWVYTPVAQAGAFEQEVDFSLPPSAPSEPLPQGTPRKAGQAGPDNQAVAAGSAGEPPAAPQRIKVGGLVQASMLMNKVDPVYPEAAKAAGIQGQVTLAVIIAKDGTVETVTPERGHPLLVAAAMDAVKQWTYKPTRLNGDPVEVDTTVTIPFELQR